MAKKVLTQIKLQITAGQAGTEPFRISENSQHEQNPGEPWMRNHGNLAGVLILSYADDYCKRNAQGKIW